MTESDATTRPRPGGSTDVLRRIAKAFVPLSRPLAGTRWFRLYGIVRHTGRRSGRGYAVPVVVRPVADGFVIPVPFERAEWVRNVLAAGGCTVRWNGTEHLMVEPVVVGRSTAAPAFNRVQRALLGRFGIERYVRLRHASAVRSPSGDVV
jgi:hypothetical protein